MKKNELALIAGGSIFSLLFYMQLPGINFPLLTILLSILLSILKPENTTKPLWWLYCVLANAAAISVFVNNSALSVASTIIASVIFCSKSMDLKISIPVSFGLGLYSIARSPFDLVSGAYARLSVKTEAGYRKSRIMITGVLTAILFSALFFMMYRSAHPLFDQKMAGINFEWLNIGWIIFTLFSFITMNGLLFSKNIHFIQKLDRELKEGKPTEESAPRGLTYDAVIAITLFSLLNIMLVFINVLDFNNIFISQQLPPGITLSEFVHGGIETLIMSIMIGAGLVAWLMRGELNFSRYGRISKLLIYGWIIQNIFVILSAMVRNIWYIQEYQLTGQRIGVFVFLILVLMGLVLTYLKVTSLKSAWWLVSNSAQIGFLMLVITSLFNWDQHITRYNISHSGIENKTDYKYLIRLSDANLPQLVQMHNQYKLSTEEKKQLYRKLHQAYLDNRNQQWPSYSLRMKESNEALLELEL